MATDKNNTEEQSEQASQEESAGRLTLQVDPNSETKEVTYWTIVWDQFKTNKIAYYGLWMVIGLVLLAVYAPALCLEQPFVISYTDRAGQSVTEYPWVISLLGDRNLFENGVDIFFNLLMVLSPLMAISGFIVSRITATKRRAERMATYQRVIAGWTVTVLAGMVLLTLFPSSQPYKNYVEIYSKGHAQAQLEITKLRLNAARTGATIDPAQIKAIEDQTPSGYFPPIPQSFRDSDLSAVLAPMSINHFFGTDDRGRDVFARMLYGTRIGLTIGVVAVSIYIFIGIILGSLAGFFGGWVDVFILRLVEIMICFPSLILIMTLAAFIEKPTIFHIMVIIGVIRWTGTARLTRGEFLKLKNQEFVSAAIASGIPMGRVIFRHVLPNALSPVLVTASFGVASAILLESTLSFLGLGDASAPAWGELINIGRQTDTMSLILLPGLAIFFTVSLFNLVGEGLQDALDPKRRR